MEKFNSENLAYKEEDLKIKTEKQLEKAKKAAGVKTREEAREETERYFKKTGDRVVGIHKDQDTIKKEKRDMLIELAKREYEERKKKYGHDIVIFGSEFADKKIYEEAKNGLKRKLFIPMHQDTLSIDHAEETIKYFLDKFPESRLDKPLAGRNNYGSILDSEEQIISRLSLIKSDGIIKIEGICEMCNKREYEDIHDILKECLPLFESGEISNFIEIEERACAGTDEPEKTIVYNPIMTFEIPGKAKK